MVERGHGRHEWFGNCAETFSWTFPPDVPELRYAGEMTQVVVLFDEKDDGQVTVKIGSLNWQATTAAGNRGEYAVAAASLLSLG